MESKYHELERMSRRSIEFFKKYLSDPRDIDCFGMHVLQIYSAFLFDNRSINENGKFYGGAPVSKWVHDDENDKKIDGYECPGHIK